MGMTRLAIAISPYAGRIVVDRTTIAAPQDFDLMWTSEQAGSPPTGDRRSDSNAPSLFTAIEEQLGLKLQPTEAPVDVLVIDRVEKPTPD
jgi:uncharacterized protein (TIGR03435 family)